MGNCILKSVKIENEVFGMLEFIADKDPNEACKYADGYLQKKLKPAQSTQLNALKTRIVHKAVEKTSNVTSDVLGGIMGGISNAVMKNNTVADIVGTFSGVVNNVVDTVGDVVATVNNVENAVSNVVSTVDNVANTVSEVVGAVDNVAIVVTSV